MHPVSPRVSATCFMASVAIAASTAHADLIEEFDIGSGLFMSHVQVDFNNGNAYLFNVSYMEDDLSGWDLMLEIAESMDDLVDLDYSESQWGVFLTGIAIGDDHDWGDGSGWPDQDDYWAYWITGSNAQGLPMEWASSPVGASDRIVHDGSWDGWTFNIDGASAPQPVPAPGVLPCLLLALNRGGRARRG